MSYVITPIDSCEGRDAILDLWRRNLSTAPADRYAWLYEGGPAASWLLASGTGQSIGSTGLMLRNIHSPAGTLRAGQATDLNVDQDHRSAGPALGLGRAVTAMVREGKLDLIYGFPNEKSEVVLRRIGYKAMGDLTRWVKPLSSAKRLPPWLRGLWPRKLASRALDCLLRLKSPEWRYPLPAGTRVHVTDRFDDRFDRLWQTAAPRFCLVGERTSAYLNWRFGQCPSVVHRVFYLLGESGQILAYLVYSRKEQAAYVSDFFFVDVSCFELLLAQYLRQMRREKVASVGTNYAGWSAVPRTLKRFGFWRSPSQWKAMLFFDPRRLGDNAERLLDREKWFLTRADVDTDD